MMNSTNLNDFRGLLNKAMDGRSRKVFAHQARLAPELLRNLLEEPALCPPPVGTLQKIADTSEGRVTMQELRLACGLDGEAAFEQFVRELDTLLDDVRISDAIVSSLDQYVTRLSAAHDICITTDEPVRVHDSDRDYGEYALLLHLVSTDCLHITNEADAVLFFFRTVTGQYVIRRITAAVEKAAEYGGATAGWILRQRRAGKPCPGSILRYAEGENPIEREQEVFSILPELILEKPGVKRHISGIGFYIGKNLPEYVFRDFFRKHRKTFCSNSYELKLCFDYLNGNADRTEAFARYADADTPDPSGWLRAVTSIIQRETGVHLQYRSDVPYRYLNRRTADCIFWENDYLSVLGEDGAVYTVWDIIGLLDRYAVELRGYVTSCEFNLTESV